MTIPALPTLVLLMVRKKDFKKVEILKNEWSWNKQKGSFLKADAI